MRASSILVAVATLFSAAAVAAPSNIKHLLHEKRDGNPHHWGKRSRAPSTGILPIRIGLRQRNLENAEEYIKDVSDPSSANFGKHWSAEKVANTFAPARETRDGVTDWLISSGINRDRITYSTGQNWIHFDGTVEEAERLLNTEYWYYQHKHNGGYRIACDSYSLPEHVKEHIDFAMPTIQLDGLKPIANLDPARVERITSGGLTGLSNCSGLITIECLRALYKFPAGNSSNPTNKMGIGEWADYLYEPDLPIFFNNYTTPKIPNNTVPDFISIDGGLRANLTTVAQGSGVESALDFQVSYSIIWPQQLRLYQVGDGINVDSVGTFNIFLDALDESFCTYAGGDAPYLDPQYPDPNDNEMGYQGQLQCGGSPTSNVFSFSYGQIEGALPRFYQQRQCHEWMKLGLQGVSVLFASGDSGVANRYNAGYPNSCLNDENLYVDNNGTRFSPSFPVNCPYVTAVGATFLKNSSIAGGEVAVADPDPSNQFLDFYSGGGFSNVFELPSYQADAVNNYLKNYNPGYGPNVYNQSGNARGFPDVAAIGLKVVTVFNGKTLAVGGTSASCPIVASIVTLLNERRLAAGKGPIGFLNPVFYAHPEAFNDVTEGSNPGCYTNGFQAAPGWDPVTGLGSPNFEKLLDIFLSLP
ncbi:subtilisin-like protein [Viridothelium virens]|uniref:tripeptidyl-peptidase II n=1 Tax=Viridothelium virens TaxID=1048519 RepID=A0A6A6H2D2_VIRVR|nr:subtilisin-like protein [Viridothelium virens]